MKIVLVLWYSLNGVPVLDAYRLPTPFYVRNEATCEHYREAVVQDYEATQPGWKYRSHICVWEK